MTNNIKNSQILNQLIDELITVLMHEDQTLSKNKDKPSNKNSYPYTVHLAKTIKEYLNDPIS